VKLMPPKYVKADVKRGKTNAGDAAAICAVGRGTENCTERRDQVMYLRKARSGTPSPLFVAA
jgi:hypothetical protein